MVCLRMSRERLRLTTAQEVSRGAHSDVVPPPTLACRRQEYAALRRNPQEAAYNLGRAAHQMGLLHLAVPLYERALAEPGPDPGHTLDPDAGAAQQAGPPATAAAAAADGQDPAEPWLDGAGAPRAGALCLKREAAHNLAQLYRAIGAPGLARQVVRRYLVF